MLYRRLLCITSLIALFVLVAQGQNRSQLSERPNLIQSFAALPMGFEQNQGQADDDVRFLSRGAGYSVYLSRGGMLLAFDSRTKTPTRPELVHISLAHANPEVEPQGTDLLPGITNYYIGNEPAKWQTGVRQFRRVVYHGVYPGIDLVFYGNHRQLEFDFDVAAGVDPARIALRVDGARVRKNKDGLQLVTPSGSVAVLKQPVFYQGGGKVRHKISGGYVVRAKNEVAFKVGSYDPRLALVIDPALVYSTLVGAALIDMTPFAVAVDGSGAAYVTGISNSPGPLPSAFVLKLDPSGSSLVYETRLAGTVEKFPLNPNTPAAGFGIAVDANANAYIAGLTDETDFPVTAGAFSKTEFCASNSGNVGCLEPFAAKLDATGKVVFATFLTQDSAVDNAGPIPSSLAVDSSGAIYVTGTTAQQTTSFLGVLSVAGLTTTAGAFQISRKSKSSGFVLKLHPDGSKVDYATYIGGSTGETPGGIAVDSTGVAYVDGGTSSADFPVTAGASLTTNPGTAAFFSKLKSDGSSLLYSTFLAGPNGQAEATSIAIDSTLAAYLTGMTNASFPAPAQAPFSLPAFAAKFDSSGNLAYSTLLGTQMTYGLDLFVGSPPSSSIAVDAAGAAYPASGFGGFFLSSMVVSKVNFSGSVVYTAPIGPIDPHNSRFGGVALDSNQNLYVAGIAGTLIGPDGVLIPDIGTTAGAFQTQPLDPTDPQEIMFVQKWAQSLGAGVPVPNPRQISFSPILQPGTTSSPRTITLLNYGDADLTISSINIGGANPGDFTISSSNNTCAITVHANQNCSFQVVFTPAAVGPRSAAVNLAFGGGVSAQTVGLSGQGGVPVFQASPASIDFGSVGVGVTSGIFNLVISNTGTARLNLLNAPVFQGTNNSDFSPCVLAAGHCGQPFVFPAFIPPSSSITVPLVFTPGGSGSRTAQLVFTTDASGSPQSVSLRGTGANLGISAGSDSSATVTAGQTATYNLSVTTSSTFNGAVTVNCTGAPALSTCTPNPNSFSLGPSSGQSVTVTVTTTHAFLGARNGRSWGWPTLAPVFAILMIPGRRRRWRRAFLGVGACLMLAMLMSCGSSGHSPGPGSPGTPPGTYTLTVTATANGASSSMPLTLTVQ